MPIDDRRKLLIADDHDFILCKVKEIVANQYKVVATLNDGSHVADAIETLKPELAILDISMPLVGGLSAGREVVRRGLPVKLVFLTISEDADCMQAALDLGASFVLKRRMHLDLLTALNEACAGRSFVSQFSAASVSVAR